MKKNTRGMEIITSNVSPKIHFFSKAIAANLFVIIQCILLIIYAVLGIYLLKIIGSSITSGLGVEVTGMLEQFINSGVDKDLDILYLLQTKE